MNRIVSVKQPKPRNPFAALAARRTAGAHRTGAGGLRQRSKQALRRELHLAADGPPGV